MNNRTIVKIVIIVKEILHFFGTKSNPMDSNKTKPNPKI